MDGFERVAQHVGHTLAVTFSTDGSIVFIECKDCIEQLAEFHQQTIPYPPED
jgi:hypothetical protein